MQLRHDISHRTAIKFAIEQLLGCEAWYELKETTSIAPWRRNVLKVLKAIRVSIEVSVEVRDSEWVNAVHDNLNRGAEGVKSSKDIDTLLSWFEATLLRQVFLHIGDLPDRSGRPGVTLRKENWRLNRHRSVQYVQSQAQLEAVFWSRQQGLIGFERQIELHNEHRRSKSQLPYSVWCQQREI